jgi:hypothetical protein
MAPLDCILAFPLPSNDFIDGGNPNLEIAKSWRDIAMELLNEAKNLSPPPVISLVYPG